MLHFKAMGNWVNEWISSLLSNAYQVQGSKFFLSTMIFLKLIIYF